MSLPTPHPGERKALKARRDHEITLGGPVDILDVAEEHFGAPVLIERFDDSGIAGVLLRRARGDCFIGINADYHTVKQRFTLAHELGHLFMGHQARVDLATDVFGRGSNAEEVEANYFAAEFLLPREMVRAWLEDNELVSAGAEPATVARLALQFGVALPTACYRLERAGVNSAATTKRLVAETLEGAKTLIKVYAAQRYVDSMHSIWQADAYPRVPRRTALFAAKAREADLIDEEEYNAIIAAPADIDFNDWLQ